MPYSDDARLRREPHRAFVSSFKDVRTAEYAISEVMHARAPEIKKWAQHAEGNRTLRVSKMVTGDIGYVIARANGKLVRGNNVRVVLRRENHNDMPYFILTAYIGL